MHHANCPYCGGVVGNDPRFAGHFVTCPYCRRPFQLPALQVVPARSPESPFAAIAGAVTEDLPERIRGEQKSRMLVNAIVGLVLLVLVGTGGWFVYSMVNRLAVKECYVLDMVVIDPAGRGLNAVVLGIRTTPSADSLDTNDIELVAPDGSRFNEVRVSKLGQESWLMVIVPEKYATGGGLKLRQKSSGRVADLPARIEFKRIDDIK